MQSASLKSKLWWNFTIITSLLAITAIAGWITTERVAFSTSERVSEAGSYPFSQIDDLSAEVSKSSAHLQRWVLEKNADFKQRRKASWNQVERGWAVLSAQVSALPSESVDRLNILVPQLGRVQEIVEGLSEDAEQRFSEQVSPLTQQVVDELDDWKGAMASEAQDFRSSITQELRNMRFWIFGSFLVLFCAIFFLTQRFSSSIFSDLSQAHSSMEHDAESLLESIKQLSNASQKLINETKEQVEIVESKRLLCEKISNSSKDGSSFADSAFNSSEKALVDAERSHEAVEKIISSLEGIDKSIKQMATVIKAINDIACQTSLLALNANVEAARAAEFGSGFAVVAEEVRTLAQRSTEAVKSTNALIEQSLEKCKEGCEFAKACSQSLNETLSHSKETREALGKFKNLSCEQRDFIQDLCNANSGLQKLFHEHSNSIQSGHSSRDALLSKSQVLHSKVGGLRQTVLGK